MDDNDAPPSRVPAGTFGNSTPPESATDEDAGAGPARPNQTDRKRFVNTLVGEAALADADAAELEALERKRQSSTWVGHPPRPASEPTLPGSAAPVLAPPKWRGAAAYLEGEKEPQPRVSSIPAPPPLNVPANPSGVAVGKMRSKITTKVGLPTVEKPTTAAELPREPEIDDEIQQMLEGQASVPMQVEEPIDVERLREIPLDELPIEELASEPPPERTKATEAEAAPASAAPQAALPSAARSQGEPVRGRTPDAARARDARPTAGGTADRPARERRAVSSLAPAEVRRRPASDDAQTGYGFLFLAVMLVVGGGGWLLTRGGYSGMRTQGQAPAAAARPAPSAVGPRAPSDLAPAPAAALTSPEPPRADDAQQEPAEARVERAPSERTASKPAARRGRTGAKSVPAANAPGDAQGASAQRQGAMDTPGATGAPVLTVRPRTEPETATGNMPDIPSREAVIDALEPLREAMSACVRGQHGVAQLDITVSGAGYVTHAVVGGDFAGTPDGSCIARAARGAKFAPFKKPRFRVIYPFSL